MTSPGYIKMEATNGNLQNSLLSPMGVSTRELRNVESPRKNVAADEFELKKLLKAKPGQSSTEGKKSSSFLHAQNSSTNSPVGRSDKVSPTASIMTPGQSNPLPQFTLNPSSTPDPAETSQHYRLPKYFLITAFAEEETTYPDIKSVHPSAVKSLTYSSSLIQAERGTRTNGTHGVP